VKLFIILATFDLFYQSMGTKTVGTPNWRLRPHQHLLSHSDFH